MTTPDPTDAELPGETPKREVPFDKDDLTFGPDDVVENSDAAPEADPGPADGDADGDAEPGS
jgi:hypothetical protein